MHRAFTKQNMVNNLRETFLQGQTFLVLRGNLLLPDYKLNSKGFQPVSRTCGQEVGYFTEVKVRLAYV